MIPPTYPCSTDCPTSSIWRVGQCSCHNSEIARLRRIVRELGAENERLKHDRNFRQMEFTRMKMRIEELERALVRN